MKPSERIKEIAYGLQNDMPLDVQVYAIIKYLDEQYEQQKPCEEVVCGKCGLSGQIDRYGLCWSSRCTDTRETL